jgi:DNA gyrase/topoisomerase IV subunit B
MFQAILPLRGKILNVESDAPQGFENEEIEIYLLLLELQ